MSARNTARSLWLIASLGVACNALEGADAGAGDDGIGNGNGNGNGGGGMVPGSGGFANNGAPTELVDDLPPGFGGSGNPATPLAGCENLPLSQTVQRIAQDSRSFGAAAYAREALSAFAETPFGLPPAPSGIRAIEVLNAYGLGYGFQDNGILEAAPKHVDAVVAQDDVWILQVPLVAPPDVDRRPVHVVFVVDTSVSMSGPSMALQKTLLNQAAASLGEVPGDMVSMVTWTSESRVILEPKVVDGPSDGALVAAIEALDTEGGANLALGLRTALDMARGAGPDGGSKRLVFVSDGATTLDDDSISVLAEIAGEDPMSGVGFIGVGVGPGEAYHPVLLRNMVDASDGALVYVANDADAAEVFDARFDELMDAAGYDARLVLDIPGTLIVPHPAAAAPDETEAALARHALAIDGTMVFQIEVTACNPGIFAQSEEVIEGHIEYIGPDGGTVTVDVGPVPIASLPVAGEARMARTLALLQYADALEHPTPERVLAAQSHLVEIGSIEPDLAPLADLLGRHPVLTPLTP